jgi:hypothetical protein
LGVARGWNRCIDRSKGIWVHILHHDDYLLPGFYEKLEQTQKAFSEVSLVATRSFFVDDNGCIEGVTERVRSLESGGHDVQDFFYHNPIPCPGIVVRKSFYEQHSGFRTDLSFTVDMEMWARCISKGGGVILPQILACYRKSDGNGTSRAIRTIEALEDQWRMNRIFDTQYPGFNLERADRNLCNWAMVRVESFAQSGDASAVAANMRFWREHAPMTMRVERIIRKVVRRVLRLLRD